MLGRPPIAASDVVVPASHALDGVVAAAGADDRADDDALVHAGGHAREDLADLDAGDVGGDRLELAADFGRGVGLDVPHILVRRSAAQEDVDDRLVPRAGDAGAGLGAEDVGEGQAARRRRPARRCAESCGAKRRRKAAFLAE